MHVCQFIELTARCCQSITRISDFHAAPFPEANAIAAMNARQLNSALENAGVLAKVEVREGAEGAEGAPSEGEGAGEGEQGASVASKGGAKKMSNRQAKKGKKGKKGKKKA